MSVRLRQQRIALALLAAYLPSLAFLGESVDLELTFEKAGVVKVDAPVQTGGMMQHADGGGMGGETPASN